jgi:hypothetical protein
MGYTNGFSDGFGEEFARFLQMCELVIMSHELKLLVMGTVSFIGKILPNFNLKNLIFT